LIMTTTTAPGFFGKIPSHGDFINRRVARSFLEPWDDWLQRAVARSREQLDKDWLDTYLTSPIWRFVLSPGVCSDQPHAGVLMPSVDKVGRYFPLTITVAIPKGFNILQLPKDVNEWFDKAEQQALSALEEPFNLDEFDREVEQLDVPVAVTASTMNPTASAVSLHTSGKSMHTKIPASHDMVGPYVRLLHHYLTLLNNNYSVWWTSGSHKVQPCMLTCAGLPPVDGFSAFLDGRWSLWGWQQEEESHIVYEKQPMPEDTDTDAAVPHIPADWEYPV
jgi:type VI secretion system protein ImpM